MTLGKRTARSVGRVCLALLLVGGALGCNELDLEALTTPKREASSALDEASAKAEAPPAARDDSDFASGDVDRERAPDMESIGGDDARRVYYQFIDDRGGVHFVERLTEVPMAWRDRVGFVEMDRPPPLTPAEARKAWTLSTEETIRILAALPAPARRARSGGGRQASTVLLYSAEWCGWCRKAEAHLDDAGIDYEYRDVDIRAIASELREKTGRGGVPVLDYDGQILRGYSKDGYDRAIEQIEG